MGRVIGVGILNWGTVEHLGVAPATLEPLKPKDKLVNKGFRTREKGESLPLRHPLENP